VRQIRIEPYHILCPRDRLMSPAAQRLLALVQARLGR